jgi:hypothetical protein
MFITNFLSLIRGCLFSNIWDLHTSLFPLKERRTWLPTNPLTVGYNMFDVNIYRSEASAIQLILKKTFYSNTCF